MTHSSRIATKTGVQILVDDDVHEWASRMTWHITRKGYAATNVRINGRFHCKLLHRLIIGDPSEGLVVDHVNCDKLDNRRQNLRFVDYSTNAINRPGANKNNKLGVRGVYFKKGAYNASFRSKYIGSFRTIEEAVEALRVVRSQH